MQNMGGNNSMGSAGFSNNMNGFGSTNAAGMDALSQAYSGIQQYAGLSGLVNQGKGLFYDFSFSPLFSFCAHFGVGCRSPQLCRDVLYSCVCPPFHRTPCVHPSIVPWRLCITSAVRGCSWHADGDGWISLNFTSGTNSILQINKYCLWILFSFGEIFSENSIHFLFITICFWQTQILSE